jgi:tryptophan synthase alpha chain
VVIGTKLIQLLDNEPRDRVAPVAAEFLAGVRAAMDNRA